MATSEEIEKLKESYKKDPCWDIEGTEGFDEHGEELLDFRKKWEAECEAKRNELDDARADIVREQTGVIDADIVSELHTWHEIEYEVLQAERVTESRSDNIAAAQVRATLLMAAQMKRIADALENMGDSDSLITAAKIWGSGE